MSYPQTPCKAMGAMGLEPVVIQGPIRTPATALCSPSISNEEIQPPFQLLLLWTPPHPINCKHFVDAAGVNDPDLLGKSSCGIFRNFGGRPILEREGPGPWRGISAWPGPRGHEALHPCPPHRPWWRGFFLREKPERFLLRAEASESDSSTFSRLWFLSASGQPERQW